ncbi:hypothetical protein B9Z19DRAFT_1128514 [Tuber borchii]|uniref:Uncharacterized protein n=1 Tax=Tuber borchii TaxID=42251 RepID=A0A2T6ZPA2_TUBBO|nr:hypothetical protein B9Z19DRAFT_1128514 [Tuber borchii]
MQRYAVGLLIRKSVRSGDYVSIKPHHCMTHDNSWPAARNLFYIGAPRIHDNRQVAMTPGHDLQNGGETSLGKYQNIKELAKDRGYWEGCNCVSLSLCGLFNNDEVLNHAIEFGSEQTLEWLKIDDSLTIANMTT